MTQLLLRPIAVPRRESPCQSAQLFECRIIHRHQETGRRVRRADHTHCPLLVATGLKFVAERVPFHLQLLMFARYIHIKRLVLHDRIVHCTHIDSKPTKHLIRNLDREFPHLVGCVEHPMLSSLSIHYTGVVHRRVGMTASVAQMHLFAHVGSSGAERCPQQSLGLHFLLNWQSERYDAVGRRSVAVAVIGVQRDTIGARRQFG